MREPGIDGHCLTPFAVSGGQFRCLRDHPYTPQASDLASTSQDHDGRKDARDVFAEARPTTGHEELPHSAIWARRVGVLGAELPHPEWRGPITCGATSIAAPGRRVRSGAHHAILGRGSPLFDALQTYNSDASDCWEPFRNSLLNVDKHHAIFGNASLKDQSLQGCVKSIQ